MYSQRSHLEGIFTIYTPLYSPVCYNERYYNERMLQRKFLSIKLGCYKEQRCYNERGGILLADVARACP